MSERAVSVTRLSQCFVDHWAVCERQRACVGVGVGVRNGQGEGVFTSHFTSSKSLCFFCQVFFQNSAYLKCMKMGENIASIALMLPCSLHTECYSEESLNMM